MEAESPDWDEAKALAREGAVQAAVDAGYSAADMTVEEYDNHRDVIARTLSGRGFAVTAWRTGDYRPNGPDILTLREPDSGEARDWVHWTAERTRRRPEVEVAETGTTVRA